MGEVEPLWIIGEEIQRNGYLVEAQNAGHAVQTPRRWHHPRHDHPRLRIHPPSFSSFSPRSQRASVAKGTREVQSTLNGTTATLRSTRKT